MQLAVHYGLRVTATAHSKEEYNVLSSCGLSNIHVLDLTTEPLSAAEVTGHLGFDFVVQLDPLVGVSRMSIIQLLAPQGTWVTGEALQLDAPESSLLLRIGATLSFAFQPIWLLAPTQQGRFLHILTAVMDLAGKGILKPRNIATFPLERARQAIRDFGTKPGKFVLRV